MKRLLKIALLVLPFIFFGCQSKTAAKKKNNTPSEIKYAKGFSLKNYGAFSIVTVSNPWPNSNKTFTYVLHKKNSIIPDSLKRFQHIQIPIKNIVVTSTTHIPSLEMLDVTDKLIGFPNLNYISSEKVRARIDAKKIKELGSNQSLNTEALIDMQPEVIIGYGIDNTNPMLDNLQKSGLKVVLNGDWNEQSPLGKAEWIKLFGALFDKQTLANSLFKSIEHEYTTTLSLVKNSAQKPSILAGALYEDKWYLPQGESWGAQFLANAGGNYLWQQTKGTGSLALSFEEVIEKGLNADFWIGPGQFTSLADLAKASENYTKFKAYKTKNIYTFSAKKGKTGGVIYYELAPNRPDIVLKDLVKILHPDLLPNHTLYFFQKLN